MTPPDDTLIDPDSAQDGADSPPGAAEYEPGDQIAARYEVLQRLGRGASGVVYRVRDRASGEEMAVKIIDDPVGGVDQLRREVRLAWRVTHANVVRVFDIVEHRHGALLSMQYAAGGTLADRIGTPMGDGEVRAIMAPILDGLEAAHEAGVIHRDLKPANILFSGAGQIQLSDFGVAELLDSGREGHEAGRGGTPAYMAPEQLTGGAVDARTDLYALGIVAYQLATGSLPFVTPGEQTTLSQARQRIEQDIPPIPGALAAAVARLTRRDPDQRPRSVAEVRELFGIGGEVGAGPLRKAPWWAAAIAVGALAAVVRLVLLPAGPAEEQAVAAPEPVVHALTAGDEIVAPPTASMGDGSVVMASNRLAGDQLWAIDARDATTRALTSGPAAKRAPQWVGDWLYFEIERDDERHDLVRLPQVALTAPRPGSGAETVWPDVERARVSSTGDILFLERYYGVGQPARIRVIAAGRGSDRVLGPDETEITWADWSPSGGSIAYTRRDQLKDEVGSLWQLDPETDRSRLLAEELPAWAGFDWVDDERIVFFRGDGELRELVAVDIATGDEVSLAQRLAYASWPTVTGDGRLIYVTDRLEYGIWIHDGTGPLSRATSLGSGHAKSPSWVTTNDELVYLVEMPGEGLEVRRVRGDTYSEITARRTLGGDNPYVAMSPDGRHVVYGEQRESESLLMVADIDSDASPRVLDRTAPPAVLYPIEFAVHGTRVTYIHEGTDGVSQIRDVTLDGTDPRLLVEDGGSGVRSRDGSWICYQLQSLQDEGGLRVQRTGTDGRPTGERRLVPGTAEVWMYRFGPGATEMTAMDEAELFVVDFVTGERRRLADLPRGTYHRDRMSVHPDGRVAMMLGVGIRNIVAVENFNELLDAATSP